MFEIATVLNIPETAKVLKFLHSINALNYKNVINRYIRKLTITENKINIKFIELLELIEIQRRERLSIEYPSWQDGDFDDFLCVTSGMTEIQIKNAISQIVIKHIHHTLKFGDLIIDKVQQFDHDQDNVKMNQSILEIKNKLYELHCEQCKELN